MAMPSLPPQILIRRYNNEDSLLYCLINVHNDGTELTFTVEKRQILDNIFYKRPVWQLQEEIQKICVRYGKRRKEYISNFMYTGFMANIVGQDIPIWEVNNPYSIMPNEFMFLNRHEIYQFIIVEGYSEAIAEIPTLVPPPRTITMTDIQKKLSEFCYSNRDSCCPITMEAFNPRTLCLTPCGHGVKHSAMLEWLRTKEQCPMCRAECKSNQLIKW
jgi:hypothetical protein